MPESESSTFLIYATQIWCSAEPQNLIALSYRSLQEAMDSAIRLTEASSIVWRITAKDGKLIMSRREIEEEYLRRKGYSPDPGRSVEVE